MATCQITYLQLREGYPPRDWVGGGGKGLIVRFCCSAIDNTIDICNQKPQLWNKMHFTVIEESCNKYSSRSSSTTSSSYSRKPHGGRIPLSSTWNTYTQPMKYTCKIPHKYRMCTDHVMNMVSHNMIVSNIIHIIVSTITIHNYCSKQWTTNHLEGKMSPFDPALGIIKWHHGADWMIYVSKLRHHSAAY